MRTLAITLLAAAVSLAASQERKTEDPVDPVLRRLAAAHPDRFARAFVRLQPGADSAPPAGVTYASRAGNIVTARGPAAKLAALADRASRIEPARRCRLLDEISGASTIAFRGSTTGETDTYTFNGTAGQTVRVRVLTEGSLDPLLTVTDAAPLSDDNSGPGNGAQLDVTWATSGAKTVEVAPAAATTGAYLLLVTADTPIEPDDLTGGDIGAETPHFAGTRAREARSSTGVDGSGVLIGIVDTGIDSAHADFIKPGGGTRIVGIWDQTLTATGGERVPVPGYGVFYDENAITTPGVVRSLDTEGHGTHVASIAAGGSATFPGAAPGASIFAVKFDGTTAGVVDGVNFIIWEAEELGFEAIVINLSLGTHDGPHDGSSLFDQAITAATGRGRHIVCAAGNEEAPSDAVAHAAATVSSPVTWRFTPSSTRRVNVDPPHVVDIWANGADRYVVDASNGVSSASAISGATGVGDFGSTKVTIENRVDSPPNGGTHIRIEINSLSLLPWNITLTRTTAGGDGSVDGYVGSESGSFLSSNITLNPDGSVPGTITEPATSAGAIAAGAYRELFTWDRESVGTYVAPDGIGSGVAGNIALFSSRGPTRDGRQKPDVAAPGAYVGGARSADSSPGAQTIDVDGVHVYGEGTSFAAPEVVGALALLMQKNRIHTNDEIKGLLTSTALTDGFATPGNAWGPGRLNATALLSSVVTEVDVKARAGRCGQSAAGAPAGGLFPLACLGAALLVLALRRKP